VATADLTGNGRADLVVGQGFSTPPQVRAFDGLTLAPRLDFVAFDPAFTGGVFVG
jgi:hypothetical protein